MFYTGFADVSEFVCAGVSVGGVVSVNGTGERSNGNCAQVIAETCEGSNVCGKEDTAGNAGIFEGK